MVRAAPSSNRNNCCMRTAGASQLCLTQGKRTAQTPTTLTHKPHHQPDPLKADSAKSSVLPSRSLALLTDDGRLTATTKEGVDEVIRTTGICKASASRA